MREELDSEGEAEDDDEILGEIELVDDGSSEDDTHRSVLSKL